MGQPDLSEFERVSRPRQGTCPIPDILAALNNDRREKLETALARPNGHITAKGICRVLEDWGFPFMHNKYGSIASHRRGDCDCGK